MNKVAAMRRTPYSLDHNYGLHARDHYMVFIPADQYGGPDYYDHIYLLHFFTEINQTNIYFTRRTFVYTGIHWYTLAYTGIHCGSN